MFFALRDDLQTNLFENECGETVHETLRLTFHDAIGFSSSGALSGGGADGSIMIFRDTELAFVANAGVDDGANDLATLLQKYDVTAGGLSFFL